MNAEQENAIKCTARKVLSEFRNSTNKLTYRQLLDKHAKNIEMLIPAKHRGIAWLWLNVVCYQQAGKKEID